MPAPVSSLIPTALSLREAQNRPADHGDRVRVAVWDVLSTIDDPRGRRGRRHELATVLVVSLAAVLAGATTLSAIAGWAGDQPRWTLRRIGVTRRPPSLSTIRRVLLAVDADVLDAVLHAWVAALAPPAQVPAPFRAVAVDGKTCRGARGPDGTRVHLFSIVDHADGVPLGQAESPSKGFEIAAFATVLDRIDLEGVVVTADALHTQRAHARYLHRHRARYVFIVKGNQPTLHHQLREIPWAQIPVLDRQHDKGHGRRETRTLQAAGVRPRIGFPHARLAIRLTRTRRQTRTHKNTTETVYAVTSLGWDDVTAARLADIIRGHWTIENRVHHVRDTTYAEDRSQVRTGTGPRVMATLRNIAIGVLRTRDATTNIAAATRSLARRAEHLLTLLDHHDDPPITTPSTLN